MRTTFEKNHTYELPNLFRKYFSHPIIKASTILILGSILFIYNNLAIISGWLDPPPDHRSMMIVRGQDTASYLTWMGGFKTQFLIPNYHAPWQTENAYLNPLLFIVSRFSTLIGKNLESSLFLIHFFIYILTAFIIYFGLKTFTQTAQQAWASILVIFLSVPITSWLVLPSLISAGRIPWLPWMAGIGDFVFFSSDGFFHGISGSILVTFGTATMILSFSFIGRYLQTDRGRYLIAASLVGIISAFIHPFEIVVIVIAGSLAILGIRKFDRGRVFIPIATLGIAGLIGGFIYVYHSWRFEWLREVALANRWEPQNPARLLLTLGFPTILLILLIITNPKTKDKTKILLRCWVFVTLIAIYIPWLPWTQHLLDGFFFAAGVLLVQEYTQHQQISNLNRKYPKFTGYSLALLIVLSMITYSAFGWQSFRDGQSPKPEKLFSAVMHNDIAEAIEWLKQNANSGQLVLSPLDLSSWFATVPMHTMASHYLFSMTYSEQAGHVKAFYAGEMAPGELKEFIDGFGISFIVVPNGSLAEKYFINSVERASFGDLRMFEFPGNKMRSYSNQ